MKKRNPVSYELDGLKIQQNRYFFSCQTPKILFDGLDGFGYIVLVVQRLILEFEPRHVISNNEAF